MMRKIEKISATYSILASVITTITLSVILLTQPVTVNAAEQTALGYEIDFFPTAISATAGEAGFAF